MVQKGSLFIVSAPSGAGKTSLLKALAVSMPKVCVSVSLTTRTMRPHEQNGVDYHFIDKAVFTDLINQQVFLEHAKVFGNFYGTSAVWVEETRANGMDVFLEIDWQGAQAVRVKCPEAKSIFIMPPGLAVLLERLQNRCQDAAEVIEQRMNEALEQLSHYTEYDYLLCNHRFEEALSDLKSIVRSHRLERHYFEAEYASLIKDLTS